MILARGAGRVLSLEDEYVENLVPQALRAVSGEEFLSRLDELDQMEAPLARYREIGVRPQALRRLDRDGRTHAQSFGLPRGAPLPHASVWIEAHA